MVQYHAMLVNSAARSAFQVRIICYHSEGMRVGRFNDLFVAMFVDDHQIVDMIDLEHCDQATETDHTLVQQVFHANHLM